MAANSTPLLVSSLMHAEFDSRADLHTVSVVIPVYNGEHTLEAVVLELLRFADGSRTPAGFSFRVSEIILVHDSGGDRSDDVIRSLAASSELVRAVWLSRNFGQHAATLAGISSSSGEWIATLDEDGQHDPDDIAGMLDAALANRAQVVYARPTNPPPHGALRNWASRTAKRVATRVLIRGNASQYNSYRLILGSVGRTVAEYAGAGAYLDVALGWMVSRYATAPTLLRGETRTSGYTVRGLIGHFWRLVISSGTRALRIVSALGVVVALVGVGFAVWVILAKVTTGIDAEGWASTIVILLITSGAVLLSLGVIAEYVGVNVNRAMGKPPYLIVADPELGPLGSSRRVL
jgi:glycosyltransferase involved in cell wall biosynthesis